MDAQQAAARIREALEAGPTPGPWFSNDWSQDDGPRPNVVESRTLEVLRPGQFSIWPDGWEKHRIATTADSSFEADTELANAAYIAACSPEALRALLAERDELAKDAARLDFLDTINARKNERNGTIYGWWLNENHNRIALEDHDRRKLSSREAIDAAQAARKNKD